MNDLAIKFFIMAEEDLLSSKPNFYTHLAGGIAHGSRNTGKTFDQIVQDSLFRVLRDANINATISTRQNDDTEFYSYYKINFATKQDMFAFTMIGHVEFRERMVTLMEESLDFLN